MVGTGILRNDQATDEMYRIVSISTVKLNTVSVGHCILIGNVDLLLILVQSKYVGTGHADTVK